MDAKKFNGFAIICSFFCIFGGQIGLIIAFSLMNNQVQNFVLKPISRKIAMDKNIPANYSYKLTRKIRRFFVIFAILLDADIWFFIELFMIYASFNNIKQMKAKKYNNQTELFLSDYILYDEYFNELEYTNVIREYNKTYTEPNIKNDINIVRKENIRKNISKNIIHQRKIINLEKTKIDTQTQKQNLNEDKANKIDFDKPVEQFFVSKEINTKTEDEIRELAADEIRCEKCGAIMSKNKIVCLKCGTMVKINNNRK